MVICEIKHEENTETILKRFMIVLKLFSFYFTCNYVWNKTETKLFCSVLFQFYFRCYRYGFASESEHVNVLLDRVWVDLFHKIRCYEHCIHAILPPVLSQCYDMHHRAHSFVLPQCNSNLYKKSFSDYDTIQYNINLYSATVAEKPLVRSSVVLIVCKQICF